jgi:hypothetical protein
MTRKRARKSQKSNSDEEPDTKKPKVKGQFVTVKAGSLAPLSSNMDMLMSILSFMEPSFARGISTSSRFFNQVWNTYIKTYCLGTSLLFIAAETRNDSCYTHIVSMLLESPLVTIEDALRKLQYMSTAKKSASVNAFVRNTTWLQNMNNQQQPNSEHQQEEQNQGMPLYRECDLFDALNICYRTPFQDAYLGRHKKHVRSKYHKMARSEWNNEYDYTTNTPQGNRYYDYIHLDLVLMGSLPSILRHIYSTRFLSLLTVSESMLWPMFTEEQIEIILPYFLLLLERIQANARFYDKFLHCRNRCIFENANSSLAFIMEAIISKHVALCKSIENSNNTWMLKMHVQMQSSRPLLPGEAPIVTLIKRIYNSIKDGKYKLKEGCKNVRVFCDLEHLVEGVATDNVFKYALQYLLLDESNEIIRDSVHHAITFNQGRCIGRTSACVVEWSYFAKQFDGASFYQTPLEMSVPNWRLQGFSNLDMGQFYHIHNQHRHIMRRVMTSPMIHNCMCRAYTSVSVDMEQGLIQVQVPKSDFTEKKMHSDFFIETVLERMNQCTSLISRQAWMKILALGGLCPYGYTNNSNVRQGWHVSRKAEWGKCTRLSRGLETWTFMECRFMPFLRAPDFHGFNMDHFELLCGLVDSHLALASLVKVILNNPSYQCESLLERIYLGDKSGIMKPFLAGGTRLVFRDICRLLERVKFTRYIALSSQLDNCQSGLYLRKKIRRKDKSALGNTDLMDCEDEDDSFLIRRFNEQIIKDYINLKRVESLVNVVRRAGIDDDSDDDEQEGEGDQKWTIYKLVDSLHQTDNDQVDKIAKYLLDRSERLIQKYSDWTGVSTIQGFYDEMSCLVDGLYEMVAYDKIEDPTDLNAGIKKYVKQMLEQKQKMIYSKSKPRMKAKRILFLVFENSIIE